MFEMGSGHLVILAHFRFPSTRNCDSQSRENGEGIRKSTRFANQPESTREPMDNLSLPEERYMV